MRIAHIQPADSIGGLREHLYELKKLKDNKKHLIIFLTTPNLADVIHIEYKVISLYYSYQDLFQLETKVDELSRILTKHKIDVIHSYHVICDLVSIPAAVRAGITKIIRSVHGIAQVYPNIKSYGKVFFDWPDIIKEQEVYYERYVSKTIVVGKWLVSKMESYGLEKKKIVQIGNGVDIKDFNYKNNYVSNGGKVVIGFIGRLEPVKNILFLIKIVKSLINNYGKMFEFVIQGDGFHLKDINDLVIYAQNKGIKFEIKKTSVYRGSFWKKCDVLLFPTLMEGNPRVVLEAMASNTLIIANSIEPINEILSDESGILLKNKIPEEYSNRIYSIINQKSKMKKLINCAAAKVKKFSLTNKLKKVDDLYSCIKHLQ